MTRPVLASAAALLGALALGALPPTPSARAGAAAAPPPVDEEYSCLELTPEALSFENRPHQLKLRILLDGTTKEQAKNAVVAMRKAYGTLDIDVRPSYRQAKLEGTDAKLLLGQAKKMYGGRVPKGVDVVYTLTNKDIAVGFAGSNVSGLADCIGGIRFPDRAFAIGEVTRPTSALPSILPPVQDVAGKTMAHEVAHLLGAHHHYASIEGANGQEIATLMGPTLSIIGLRFSTLEGAAVRGHLELREKQSGK